jgi:hypothetical protein
MFAQLLDDGLKFVPAYRLKQDALSRWNANLLQAQRNHMSSEIAARSETLSPRSLCCSLETSYFYLVFYLNARRDICTADGVSRRGF